MKKIVLLFVTATTMFACAPTEVKTDNAASATGTVTTSGPDVDLIKKVNLMQNKSFFKFLTN